MDRSHVEDPPNPSPRSAFPFRKLLGYRANPRYTVEIQCDSKGRVEVGRPGQQPTPSEALDE